MKVASIVGARPNFIKLAPVSRELRKEFDEIIIHTGQHYDYEMDRIFFDELGIPEPDYHLGVGSGTHGYQTGEMIKRIEEVLMKEKTDLVIVYGDTNTTLAGALAAVKLHIKVAHVEAGLRSFEKRMPEEINRVLVDHCSDILFCPTKTAVENLRKEGIIKGVYLVGDVMVDILKECIEIAEKRSKILDELDLKPKEYYLATVHRAENTDDFESLRNIVEAFCEIGYLDMLVLEKNAKKIITDSGGVQKDAYILKVPCITLRERTEWIETVEYGWNVLVGANKEKIIRAINNSNSKFMSDQKNIFGNYATKKIVNIIGGIK